MGECHLKIFTFKIILPNLLQNINNMEIIELNKLLIQTSCHLFSNNWKQFRKIVSCGNFESDIYVIMPSFWLLSIILPSYTSVWYWVLVEKQVKQFNIVKLFNFAKNLNS